MNQTERELRAQIKSAADTPTLILEQSAHCDWDWVATFLDYYSPGGDDHEAVEITLGAAITLMSKYQSQTPNYIYAFCEMAYLRHYLNENPHQVKVLKSLAQFLSLSSGGITSADNLLSHGEAFIRNYLLGRHWAITKLGITPSNQMWVPDDFGHDAQLPIVLQAMGFMGVGFWRIGGNQPGNDCQTPSPDAPSSILSNSVGLDFIWQAADHSRVQAHWLSNSYCEGTGIPSSGGEGSGNVITWNSAAQDEINLFIQQNLNANAKTPYLFVPVDCDFCTPYANLPDIVNSWNLCNKNGGADCPSLPQPPDVAGYQVAMATFDDFMQLVQAYTAPGNPNGAALDVCYSNPAPGEIAFVPNPFFAGCYGSRPALKELHYKTTRILLQAEAMEIILEYLAFSNPSTWSKIAEEARMALAKGWMHLMPSTHHDYITGTAIDTVYKSPPPVGEQLYDLQEACQGAKAFRKAILKKIAGAVTSSPPAGGVAVAVFNSLGFGRSGLVEIPSPASDLISAVTNGEDYFPVQYTQSEGGSSRLLFMADDPSGAGVPSLGYATVYLTDEAPTITPRLSLEASTVDPGSYVMANEFISAVINPQGIAELYDLVNDAPQQNNLIGNEGSQIVFYKDNGNIYRFGNELPCYPPFSFYLDTSIGLKAQPLAMGEQGPLCCTLKATGSVAFQGETLEFTTMYALVAGEPFLRMTTTGTAPGTAPGQDSIGYSVMVKFPFAAPAATLTYGTAYHWDTRAPRNYIDWPTADVPNVEAMTFEPTHEFVIPADTDGNYLAAIYHASTPGWAIDSKGALLGCILRNTPGSQQAATGTDSDAHTMKYALRVAGKKGSATQLLQPTVGCSPGGPLGEALQFNNQMVGQVVPATSSAELPISMSLVTTVDPTAVVTTAKAGTMNETDLILRLYQPTNSPLPGVQVDLAPEVAQMYDVSAVTGQTALETTLDSENLSLVPKATSFTLTAPFAITTLTLTRDES